MIRNPYSRLLSGFLGKMIKHNGKKAKIFVPQGCEHILPSLKDPIKGFANFVDCMIDASNEGRHVDAHFSLLSQHCAVSNGYDYFLKVEQMDLWYKPFVHALGLESVVTQGWRSAWRKDANR